MKLKVAPTAPLLISYPHIYRVVVCYNKYMNTKERGDNAVGQAINFFINQGYEVCLPIGDKRDFDLVVEKDGVLQKVQVKYAGLYKTTSVCKVGLRITGGNQSFNYSKKI